MCGQCVDAKTDVCIMERSSTGAKYLLLIQEDKVRRSYFFMSKICLHVTRTKCHMSRDEPELQLIAKAIAGFFENNRARQSSWITKAPV